MFSLLNLPPTPPPCHPSRSSQSTRVSFLGHAAASHWLSILYMAVYVLLLLSHFSRVQLCATPQTAAH